MWLLKLDTAQCTNMTVYIVEASQSGPRLYGANLELIVGSHYRSFQWNIRYGKPLNEKFK